MVPVGAMGDSPDQPLVLDRIDQLGDVAGRDIEPCAQLAHDHRPLHVQHADQLEPGVAKRSLLILYVEPA